MKKVIIVVSVAILCIVIGVGVSYLLFASDRIEDKQEEQLPVPELSEGLGGESDAAQENKDNEQNEIKWEEITKDGVNEELLLQNIDIDILNQIGSELQTLVKEAYEEERANPEILITEGWARVLKYERFQKVLDMGTPAMKPLYLIIYKSPNRGEYEYLCAYALYKISGYDFDWATTDEFIEKFNKQVLKEQQ
mgnify:CR=1 FL=1